MDFIFDQFVELKNDEGRIWFASMSSITLIEPKEVDTCNVYLDGGGYIRNVQMPARVLVQKIAQRRQEAQRLLRATVK